jgi:hypothetical protein
MKKRIKIEIHPLRQKILDATIWMDTEAGEISVVPMTKLKKIIDEHIIEDFQKEHSK